MSTHHDQSPPEETDAAKQDAGGGRMRRLVGPWVDLHIACNHHNTGQRTGCAEGIEIDAGEHRTLNFNLTAERAPRLIEGADHHLLLCGVRLKYKRHAVHVGSWVWDAWSVRTDDVERLISSARFQKAFEADGGEESMWELWEEIRPNDQSLLP